MKKYIISILIASGSLLVAGSVFADLIITSPNSVSESGTCSPGQEVIGKTNTVPPQDVCGTKSAVEIKQKAAPNAPTISTKASVNAKVEVRGWDATKKAEIKEKLQTALEHNPRITSLEVSENSVLVNYGATAKLFGFISMTMKVIIEADANAKVKIHFPWYKFLVSYNTDEQNQITAKISESLK